MPKPKTPSPSTQNPPQSPADGAQSAADLPEVGRPLNIRHERFCQEMAKLHATGKGTQGEAYQAAGYDCPDVYVASTCATRLLKDARIIERIDQIRQAAVDAAQVTPERIAQELVRIGFSDIRGVVSWQGNATEGEVDEETGDVKIRYFNQVGLNDSSKLTDAQAAAISEISQGKDGSLKIKFHPKIQALQTLAKWKGMLVEEVKHSGSVTLEGLVAASMAPPPERPKE